MFGSVEYYCQLFKAGIMNNFIADHSCSLRTKYSQLRADVMKREYKYEKKEVHLQNLEKAYEKIYAEIFGALQK
ncbi:hypothetical protein MUO14_22655 [Halobacillus shinanisalinarum]|uniref:Uncharacterized protein n=1 Tax=Halobacillus shinanisalinarum TaxID=2932258 RepID=A0ABY4H0H1_9BACI|nr:hypothetical protein [Halobacillus shinanisalinarum]UOQ93152.1 hypothetical protein MUO14_22655 [Halobacillus shinanisalinarum]